MARIEGIRIRNFRALRDVTLGIVFSHQDPEPLTPMTAVIGKNGSGRAPCSTRSAFWLTASGQVLRTHSTPEGGAVSIE